MDGMTAVYKTIEADKKKQPLTKQPIIKAVIKYNETDTKVLYEMLTYIRSLDKSTKVLKRKMDVPYTHTYNTRSVKRRLC